MSWQVRLGELDEEIELFLEHNPEFPINNKREFVKFATRKFMAEHQQENDLQEQVDKLEERIKEKIH